jgi:arylformamidase
MDEFHYKKIFDISLPVEEEMLTYPGNPEVAFTPQKGETSIHTDIRFGSHTGTHMDAPSHVFFDESENVGGYNLEKMIGPARVLDVTEATECVEISDLLDKDIKEGERILLKTQNSLKDYDVFRENYIYLGGDTAEWLAEKKVALVGIDYISIKKRGGTDNRPHTALLGGKIIIYEGLRLTEVEEGEYFFVGLPLRFDSLDGAPSRVVLMQ